MLEIIIEVTPDAEIIKTVKGLKGKQCLTHPLVRGLDQVLGTRKNKTHTSEFYACTTQVVTQTQQA